MSACDHIRTVLLTDYIDNELDEKAKADVEKHLKVCPDCRSLVAMIREDISIISDGSLKEKAPPHLWRSITQKIEEERRAKDTLPDFLRRLGAILTPPKLAPALIGIILLIMGTSFFLYTQYIGQNYVSTNYEYVSELFSSAGNVDASEHEGLGTPIEEYFL